MDNDMIDISANFENVNNYNSSSNNDNFGGGIELLMNGSEKHSSINNADISISELDNLENELNGLANEIQEPIKHSFNSNLFNKSSDNSIHMEEYTEPLNINLGKSTSNTFNDEKTFDGYGRIDNININPDIQPRIESKHSKEELLKDKLKYLRMLEDLEKKGAVLSTKYSMESDINEMKGEYEMLIEEKQKKNSIKFQSNMLMSFINGLEYLNEEINPFDIHLNGFGEAVQEDIESYEDIFGQLFEKYKTKASIAPELKLLFNLGSAGILIHMSNSMFKSKSAAPPGVDDILRQNPELMKQFQTAAVNSMASTNPNFSGFVNSISNNGPPPTIPTQGPYAQQPPANRGGNNTRPDISIARSFADDNVSFKEHVNKTNQFIDPPQPSNKSVKRPDMKGPSDLGDILSGLKTKTINIHTEQEQTQINSTISIDDAKNIQNANIPKRSKRKPKSDKNTVSLDI